MRVPKQVLVWLIAAVALLWIATLADSPLARSFRFARRDANYYSEFSRACDSILAQHPVGTNVGLLVATTDESIPKVIGALKPSKILLSPNSVWIMVGVSRADGRGITWAPDESHTNTWRLSITDEGSHRILYSTVK
jgi:hypothetical protein